MKNEKIEQKKTVNREKKNYPDGLARGFLPLGKTRTKRTRVGYCK